MPVESVPHLAEQFWNDTTKWEAAVNEWLHRMFKLRTFSTLYSGELTEILSAMEAVNPRSIFLLTGTSKNQTAHVVIAGQGKILWDPSRDNSGIVAPVEGYYWITVLIPSFHYQP